MGNSRYCIFIILMTQLPTAFIQGITLLSLNSAAPAIEQFIIERHKIRYDSLPSESTSMFYLTMAQSALIWGSVVGALTVSLVLRKFSPKRSMLFAHSVNLIATLISGPVAYYTGSYESLILGRFITGVARGLGFTITVVLVAETSIRSRLGFVVSQFQLYIGISAAIGAALGHNKILGQPGLWVWLVSLPSVASLIYIIAFPWLPATPVYHLRRQEETKASALLRDLRTDDEDVVAEIETLLLEINEEAHRKPIPLKNILRSANFRLQFIIASLVMNTIQLGGTQPVMMYSDALLLNAGVDPAYVTFATMSIHAQMIVAFFVFYFLERRIGTRKVYVVGIVMASIGVLIFTISNGLYRRISWISNAAIASLIFMMFGMQLGPVLTLQSLPSELTTSATRPTVMFYSSCMFWITAAVTSTVFPYSVDAFGVYAYVPYVIICFLYIPFGVFLIPDTRFRTNIQIQQSFRKKSSLHISEIFAISKRTLGTKQAHGTVIENPDIRSPTTSTM